MNRRSGGKGFHALLALSVALMLGACALLVVGVRLLLSPSAPAASEGVALSVTPTPKPTPSPTPKPTPEPASTQTPAPTATPLPETRLTVRVVGDIMAHEKQIESALQDDGSYDFSSFFASITPSIQKADVAIGNLETVFMGEEKPYTGFPKFNCPDTLADALKDAGFDVLTMANNHAFDHRLPGLVRTLQVLSDKGFETVGANASKETEKRFLLLERNDIKLGILAYTATYNHKPDEEYMVYPLEEERVREDVAALREQGADFILAMVHWGQEYEGVQDHSQERDARMLAEAGVDAVLGSHPHVLQGMEWLEKPDGGSCPVVYSMGNFISNQQTRPRDIGVIFELDLVKDRQEDQTRLERMGYVPTLVYKSDGRRVYAYDVLPVGAMLDMEDHPRIRRIRSAWEQVVELYGTERALPLTD